MGSIYSMIFIVCQVLDHQVQVGTWHTMHLTLPVREKAIEIAKKHFNINPKFDDIKWVYAYETCKYPGKPCSVPNSKAGPIIHLDDRTPAERERDEFFKKTWES